MPEASVIIPTYNCAEFIKDAIESVLKQTYKNYEIIVVDDGSTDNTREMLTPYIDRNLINYISQENKGHACARNTGIKLARGEFIAFLDADDMWLPDKLELQIPIFYSNPEIGLVHAYIYKFTDKGEFILSMRENFSDEQIRLYSGNIFDVFFRREIYISCPTVIVRKECFDKVGFFDENLARLGFEDSEMWLRILRYYNAHYIHKPLAIYRMRLNSMSKNRKNMIEAHKFTILKLTNQYKLPYLLKNKALTAMMKEWGLGRYAIFNYAREAKRIVKSKFKQMKIKKRIRTIMSILFELTGFFPLFIFFNKLFRPNRIVILMYHRVFDMDNGRAFPFYLMGPSVKNFEKQIKYLSQRYNLISLEEFSFLHKGNRSIPPNSAIITIDDGYIDCYRNIFPILKKYNVPATIFLAAGYVGTNLLFWIDELAYCIKNTKLKKFNLDGSGIKFRIENQKEKKQAIDSIIKIFKRLKEEERKEIMNKLVKNLIDGEKIEVDLNLTWEQIREMSRHNISFGAHTVTHPILSRINDKEAEREILESKRKIEEEINKPVVTFCYPSGETETFNEQHKNLLKENGFLCAVSTISGSANDKSDLFALKRISVDKDDTMALFKSKLSGIFEIKNIWK